MTETVLETERFVLTSWRSDQLDDVIALHSDPVVAQYLTASGAVWSRQLAQEKLDFWLALYQTRRMGKLRVMRKSDGQFVGRAGYGIHAQNGMPELGYTFFREHWGQGYATEAAAGLRDWYFDNTDETHFLGIVDIRNLASINVLKKIGMTPTHVADVDGFTAQFLRMDRPER